MSTASSASNVFFSDDLPEASCSTHQLVRPVTAVLAHDEVVACGPTPTRRSASERRGVLFSHRNDTKYFHSADSIYPSPPKSASGPSTAPPPSIRSYLHEQDQNLPDSQYATPLTSRIALKSASSSSASSSSPQTLARSILKARTAQILLAASVEEGTLNNKEAARLLVCGKRPRLLARDSFQLAMMRKAGGTDALVGGKGKGRAVEEANVPGSDDSAASDANADVQLVEQDGEESEEEEVVEADGALMTGSLVDIILHGAEDLLTLEEAYTTLTHRLRLRLAPDSISHDLAPSSAEAIRIAIQPIKDEATAMVRALQRDLGRLLGRMPNSEWTSSDRESSPFRGLQPRDHKDAAGSRQKSSPTHGGSPKSPEPRQGYTEAEVRYRREAAGVGGSALRFLALLLHAPQLFQCFSDADLAALLDQAMIIPRTPKMPTPNAKRTYYLSIVLLAQMKIPAVAVLPAKDKIVRAVEAAVTDTLGTAGPSGGKDGQSQIRKEGFHAIINLLSTYPAVFLPHYTDLLPPALKGMSRPLRETRDKAAAACAAFASAKFNILYTTRSAVLASSTPQAKDEWSRAKILTQKLEYFVVAHLKTGLKAPGKVGVVYGHNGDKKTEANGLEQIFKDTIGTAEGVLWACAAWSTVVSLMGGAYANSGLAGTFDHIMDRSLQPSNNTTRPLLARTAWNHAIHAYLSSGMVSSLSEDKQMIRSYKPFQSTGLQDSSERLHLIQLPLDLALEMANAPNAAQKVLQPATEVQPAQYAWQRNEKSKRYNWMVTCGAAATSMVYAYSGVALYHRDQPAKEMAQASGLPSSDGIPLPESTEADLQLERLDRTWEKVVKPVISGLTAVQGVDQLKTLGWDIIAAITAPPAVAGSTRPHQWNLDSLLTHRYLSGQAFGIDKEAVVLDFLGTLQDDALEPYQIPAWGAVWTVRHLEELLDVFQAALIGVHGVASVKDTYWSRQGTDVRVLPAQLETVWRNLLQALCTVETLDTPVFADGLRLVSERLTIIWDADPATYLALGLSGPDGCSTDHDSARIALMSTLLEAAIDVLGPAALNSSPISPIRTESVSTTALGSGTNGQATPIAALLSHLLRTSALALPLRPAPQEAFKHILSRLLQLNAPAPNSSRVLRDITTALPELFHADEIAQLDIWRLIAEQWMRSTGTQSPAQADTNGGAVGALLVSLLIAPFRQKAITSIWHSNASQSDLDVWEGLLEVAMQRFKAESSETNEGVLDAVATQLEALFEANPRTNSSTISVSCLSSMLPHMASALAQHGSKHVPTSLLKLLSTSLFDSYPTPETLAAGTQIAISPAVEAAIGALSSALHALPAWAVSRVLDDTARVGTCTWLSDHARVAPQQLGAELDNLYCAVLGSLIKGLEADLISATSGTLDVYIDLFAPRLSRAQSPKVLKQFQRFWQTCFEGKDLDYSPDVRSFLLDVTAAVPGLIQVAGLEQADWLDEEESERKFPHSQTLATRSIPATSSQAGSDAMVVDPVEIANDSLEHERDGSSAPAQPVDDESVAGALPVLAASAAHTSDVVPSPHIPAIAAPPPTAMPIDAPLPADAPILPSPNMSEADSERVEEQIRSGDVFGPPSLVTAPAKRRFRPSKKRALGPSQSAPEIVKRVKIQSGASRPGADTTIIPGTPVPSTSNDIDGDTDDDEDEDELARPIAGPSIFNRLLVKASSFGFFSPSRANKEAELVPASKASPSRKRQQPAFAPLDPVKRRKAGAPRAIPPRISIPMSRSSSQTSTTSTSSAFLKGEVIEISDSENDTNSDDDEDEEEDELILSPETARQRRAEEEQDILQRSLLRASPIKPKSKAAPRSGRIMKVKAEEVQATQGRFDDAPDDQTPQLSVPAPRRTTKLPNPSPARTTQQARILSMVEEAATAKQAVESLDFDGVMRLLKHVNELRDAATANLQTRAVKERGARR